MLDPYGLGFLLLEGSWVVRSMLVGNVGKRVQFRVQGLGPSGEFQAHG